MSDTMGQSNREWKEVKLGDLLTLITKGTTPPKGNGFVDNGINYIKSDAINYDGRIDISKFVAIDEETHKRFNRSQLKELDILFSMAGAYLGKSGIVLKEMLPANTNQALAIIRVNRDKAEPFFIGYFLRQRSLIDYINNMSGQSAQPNINFQEISSIEINLPPLPEQKAIASVLSSLDDKIDLLHRQNKTLEAMAETLFRQWFIERKAQPSLNPSQREGGDMVKEDWEEVELEYVTSKITDGAHKSPPTIKTGFPMASVKDMHNWGINIESSRHISKEDFDELVRNDCRPLKNDIIIAKDGSYLKHLFVAPENLDVVILSSIAILRPNKKYDPILLSIFLKLDSTRKALENIVTGAVIPRIVLKDFRKFAITLPPKVKQLEALETITPLIDKCWQNVNQIETLEKMRDTLLPKLMSGEVRVKNKG